LRSSDLSDEAFRGARRIFIAEDWSADYQIIGAGVNRVRRGQSTTLIVRRDVR
jgi:hypothetical protein